jgi:hypothetical protein
VLPLALRQAHRRSPGSSAASSVDSSTQAGQAMTALEAAGVVAFIALVVAAFTVIVGCGC